MDLFKETFADKCEDSLDEYLSDCSVRLEKVNKEYLKLMKEREYILRKYPRVREVLEDNMMYRFNIPEVKAVRKVIELNQDLSWMEQKEMFFQGIRESYYFLQKIKGKK